jgi:hypothetical protein
MVSEPCDFGEPLLLVPEQRELLWRVASFDPVGVREHCENWCEYVCSLDVCTLCECAIELVLLLIGVGGACD